MHCEFAFLVQFPQEFRKLKHKYYYKRCNGFNITQCFDVAHCAALNRTRCYQLFFFFSTKR